MKTTFTVKGTHCNSCKMLIEDICSETKGVSSGKLDFKSGKLVVEHEADADLKKLKKEIEKLGRYRVVVNQKEDYITEKNRTVFDVLAKSYHRKEPPT